jgi:hypothetical protein
MYFAPDGRTTMAAPGLGYVLSTVVATAGTLAIGILPALGLGPVGLSAILASVSVILSRPLSFRM